MRKGMGGAAAVPISNNSTPGGTIGGASPRPLSPAPMATGIGGGTRMMRTGSGGSYGIFRPAKYISRTFQISSESADNSSPMGLEPPKPYSQFSLRGPAATATIQGTHIPVGTRPTGPGTPARRMVPPVSTCSISYLADLY